MTPLMLAAKHQQPDIMLNLLNHGADVHFINDKGQTTLHYAGSSGNEACVKFLLQCKPKVLIVMHILLNASNMYCFVFYHCEC